MKEIKFRGKRIDNGEWAYGYYAVHRMMLTGEMDYFIIVDEQRPQSIDPETVGQYNGLKDKNGKEIYEGDILYHSAESGAVTVQAYGFDRMWGKGEKFIVAYLVCGLVLRHISAYGNSGFETPNCIINKWPIVDAYQFWNLQRGFEVIGNIYENKELLEA